jgi:hypothetical protein
MSDRVLELDAEVYYGFGAHLLRGRIAAMEGHLDTARRELGFAKLEGLMIGDVLRAEIDSADASRLLRAVIDSEPRADRVLFEHAARRRACLDLGARDGRCRMLTGAR